MRTDCQINIGGYNEWNDALVPTETLAFRELHVAAMMGSKMVIFGGSSTSFSSSLSDTLIYDTDLATWSQVDESEECPDARLAAAFTAFDNFSQPLLFVYGGLSHLASNSTGDVFSDTWIFDGQHWQKVPSQGPPGLWGARAVYDDGYIYMYGGFETFVDISQGWSVTGNIWRFNTNTFLWDLQPLPALGQPPLSRSLSSVAVLDGSLYLVSGCQSSTQLQSRIDRCAGSLNDLWSFSLQNYSWTPLLPSGSFPNGTSWLSPLNSTAFLAYYGDLYVSVITVYNMQMNMWSGVTVFEGLPSPSGRFGTSFCQIGPDQFYLFGGTVYGTFFTDSWNFYLNNGVWIDVLADPTPPARYLLSGSMIGETIILFGGITGPASSDLWVWNSTTYLWMNITQSSPWPPARCNHATVIRQGAMFLFGGFDNLYVLGDCWKLDLNTYVWENLNCNGGPPPRQGHGLVLVDENSALLFGGAEVDWASLAYNDTWLWYFNSTESNAAWVNISSVGPAPRYQFSMERFSNNQIVVYGGWFIANPWAFSDVWAFDIASRTWRQLSLSEDSFLPVGRTLHGSAMVGCSKMIVTSGRIGNQFANVASNETFSGEFTDTNTWRWRGITTVDLTPRFGHYSGVIGHNDESCLAPDYEAQSYLLISVMGRSGSQWVSNSDVLQTVLLGCDAGFFVDGGYFNNSCVACPIATYASLPGSSKCTPCGLGTTTPTNGSTTASACALCQDDYCANGGLCTIDINNQPVCECTFWYDSDSLCHQLSVGAIALISGIGGFLLLMAIFWRRVFLWIKASRKTQENEFHKKLESQEQEYEKAWRIEWAELSIQKKVGSGAFGDVFKAFWGDRPVAVKKLRSEWSETDLRHRHYGSFTQGVHLRFEDEIKFIRRIKHANVVLCYGAGKFNNTLFLVLEFCSRGSLYEILKDREQDLPWQRRLELALDAARGLQYLHDLAEPCIHRDVKSLNILVSQGWVAKISDFGTLKAANDLEVGVDNSVGLPATQSTNVGTRLWKAPEVLSGHPHTKKSDVYSFGVVLWELKTRELPIRPGYPPSFHDSWPESYRELIEICCNRLAADRPSMEDVARKLMLMATERLPRTVEDPAIHFATSFSSRGSESLVASTESVSAEASVRKLIDQYKRADAHAVTARETLMRLYTEIQSVLMLHPTPRRERFDELSTYIPTVASINDIEAEESTPLFKKSDIVSHYFE